MFQFQQLTAGTVDNGVHGMCLCVTIENSLIKIIRLKSLIKIIIYYNICVSLQLIGKIYNFENMKQIFIATYTTNQLIQDYLEELSIFKSFEILLKKY